MNDIYIILYLCILYQSFIDSYYEYYIADIASISMDVPVALTHGQNQGQ